jgi:hypothetical protein
LPIKCFYINSILIKGNDAGEDKGEAGNEKNSA